MFEKNDQITLLKRLNEIILKILLLGIIIQNVEGLQCYDCVSTQLNCPSDTYLTTCPTYLSDRCSVSLFKCFFLGFLKIITFLKSHP